MLYYSRSPGAGALPLSRTQLFLLPLRVPLVLTIRSSCTREIKYKYTHLRRNSKPRETLDYIRRIAQHTPAVLVRVLCILRNNWWQKTQPWNDTLKEMRYLQEIDCRNKWNSPPPAAVVICEPTACVYLRNSPL